MRLAKYLAHSGIASRRAAESLIAERRVTVEAEVVTDPARDVDERSDVRVDGRPARPEVREVWAVNKPAGVVSTARDTHGRPTVTGLVRSPRRLYPVGRLDADTTGLILLTNDGALAERLTHPRYGVEKVYRARVRPEKVPDRTLRVLREGVGLDDGRAAALRAGRPAPGCVEVVVAEGRKRQVRRMLEAAGLRVTALERVSFGPLRLAELGPDGQPLARGRARRLSDAEVERLRQAADAGGRLNARESG